MHTQEIASGKWPSVYQVQQHRQLWRPTLYGVWLCDVVLRALRAGWLGHQATRMESTELTSWVVLAFVQMLALVSLLSSVVWEWGDCVWLARHTPPDVMPVDTTSAATYHQKRYLRKHLELSPIRTHLYTAALLLDVGCGIVEVEVFSTLMWQAVLLFGVVPTAYALIACGIRVLLYTRFRARTVVEAVYRQPAQKGTFPTQKGTCPTRKSELPSIEEVYENSNSSRPACRVVPMSIVDV